MATAETLLVEILVEELPPKIAENVAKQVGAGLAENLREQNFFAGITWKALRTPRRLAFLFHKVKEFSPVSTKKIVGPAVDVALDTEGRPTKALEGFARSQKVDIDDLERQEQNGRERFCATIEKPSVALNSVLPQMVEKALLNLSVPRQMRWDRSKRRFVRPVRGAILLHGSRVIAGEVMGITSGNSTCGHRLLAPQKLNIENANEYEKTLCEQAHVVADSKKRTQMIRERLQKIGEREGVFFLPKDGGELTAPELEKNDDLVNRTAEMVESPLVLSGKLDDHHLLLPKELLASCLQGQQGCFMALDASNKPAKIFAFVSSSSLSCQAGS